MEKLCFRDEVFFNERMLWFFSLKSPTSSSISFDVSSLIVGTRFPMIKDLATAPPMILPMIKPKVAEATDTVVALAILISSRIGPKEPAVP